MAERIRREQDMVKIWRRIVFINLFLICIWLCGCVNGRSEEQSILKEKNDPEQYVTMKKYKTVAEKKKIILWRQILKNGENYQKRKLENIIHPVLWDYFMNGDTRICILQRPI